MFRPFFLLSFLTACGVEAPTDAIKAGVRDQSGQAKQCYEATLASHPDTSGTVTVAWSVAAGSVSDVHIETNTTGSEELGDCIRTAVQSWTFDASIEGDVTWPFKFSAMKQK